METAWYVDLVCDEMMPAVAGEDLADAVDIFCEGIAFNIKETRQVFDRASALNLHIKLRAELTVSKSADFALRDIAEPAEISYWIGNAKPKTTACAGAVHS